MPSTLKRLDNGNIELTITIPSDRVVKTWDEVVDEYVKNTTLPGFRKGKAPRKMVEGKLSADTIQEETLKKLLPQGYVEAVKEHNLNPILNPKIVIPGKEQVSPSL